jgi:hypothetical protein
MNDLIYCLYARNKNQRTLFEKVAKILRASNNKVHIFAPRKGAESLDILYPEELASLLIERKSVDYHAQFFRICREYENINRIIHSDRELNYYPEYFGDAPVSRETKLKLLVAFFLIFEDYCAREKPDFVISEMVLGLMDGIFYEVCKKNGIKFLGIRPSKISKGIVFCDSPFDQPIGFQEKQDDVSDTDYSVVSRAQAIINSALVKGEDPHYMIRSGRQFKLFTPRALRAACRVLLDKDEFPTNSIYQKRRFNAFRDAFQRYINIRSWEFEKYVELDEYSKNYFIYAAHFEPEASVHVRAHEFSDQLGLIKLISRLLPPTSILIVKEHKGNQGFRKASFYKQISHLYNVKIVSPQINLREMTKCSSGVLTLTGRIGLECLIDGVPIIAFGQTFWTNHPRVYKPRSIDGLRDLLVELSDKKSHTKLSTNQHLDRDLAKIIISYESLVSPGTFIQGDPKFTSDENAIHFANGILNISNTYITRCAS